MENKLLKKQAHNPQHLYPHLVPAASSWWYYRAHTNTQNTHTHSHTPPSRRPRAWPSWPAAGRTRPARRWGSWWWSAERAPATPRCTPARYRTPRRRSGAPAARRRSCTAERRPPGSRCSWRTSESRGRGRRWGRATGHGRWSGRNCAQRRRAGKREGRSRPTRWAKSWCRSGGRRRTINVWRGRRRRNETLHGPPCACNGSHGDWLLNLKTEEWKGKRLLPLKHGSLVSAQTYNTLQVMHTIAPPRMYMDTVKVNPVVSEPRGDKRALTSRRGLFWGSFRLWKFWKLLPLLWGK